MSWLSVTLRKSALGTSIADAFLGLEQKVTAGVIGAPPVQELQHKAIDDVGERVKQIVVDKIAQIAPGAETVSAEVATPLFAYIEAAVEHFLQNAEGTMVDSPHQKV